MRTRFATSALVAVLGLLCANAASAQVRVGANLNRPANAAYGCETLPTTDAFGNRFFLPSGVGTCTYVATGSLGNTTEVAQAPFGGGLVTAIRVKAGPRVGPMQVTVSRALRSTTPGVGFACCFYAGASQVFTPAPNTVTQVPVRIPVRSDLDPQVGETVDYLGITVLAPGVPIPAHEIGNPGNLQNPAALGFFPHLQPRDAVSGRVDGAGIGGVQPLLSADVLRFCGAGAALAAGRRPRSGEVQAAQGRCVPFLGISGGVGRVSNGRAALVLLCNAPVPCSGRLLLQSRRVGRAAAAAKPITYAATRVAVPAGASKQVKPKLRKAGRRLLRGRKRAKVWANARLASGSIVARVSRRMTLRR